MKHSKHSRKKHGRLRGWLPWHAFDGYGLDWRPHADNIRDMTAQDIRRHILILLVVGLVLATCIGAYRAPQFSLLIDLVGGLLVATVVLFLTGQWQELRRGLIETGHWPTANVQIRMIQQYAADTLVAARDRRRRRRQAERIQQEEAER